jgi:hypothetical protein
MNAGSRKSSARGFIVNSPHYRSGEFGMNSNDVESLYFGFWLSALIWVNGNRAV